MDGHFGQEIREVRRRLGWDASEMAEFLDRSRTTVYNWEQGRTCPKQPVIAIVRVMRKEYEDLRCRVSVSRLDQWTSSLKKLGAGGYIHGLFLDQGWSEREASVNEELVASADAVSEEPT